MVKNIVKSKKNKLTKKKHKLTKKANRKKGGSINDDNIFQYIKSIGFEIETTDLIKFTIEKYESKDILVNSALTNIDLEYGYFDENEYTDIIDTPDLKFKITNDSAEDSAFNEELVELVDIHKNDADCESVVFKLNIPKNEYLKQTEYDIKIREPDTELHNCSSFTDVEWIITYYKPQISRNIILSTFYNSMMLLREHLSKLITIQNSQFYYLNEENVYVKFENAKINQSYVLPGTTLLYFNNSIYDIQNFDINQNLKIVVQMTFSCDILYVYRIMKKLLAIEYSGQQIEIVKKYAETFRDNTNIKVINDLIQQTTANENFDLQAIDSSLGIVKNLFQIYNTNPENREYLFVANNDIIKKIKMYFFLIIYKVYIYLNSNLQNKKENRDSLFKKSLSFAVRHSNYFLYLEIKKLIRYVFATQFNGKDEQYINNKIIEIINNIIKPIDSQKELLSLLFQYSYIRNKKKELYKLLIANPEQTKEYFGSPLYSISSYFYHFENLNKEEHETEEDETEEDGSEEDETEEHETEEHEIEENRDWLVLHNVDEKSTKFELNNDTIIIEFRDFPSYCYLNLFISSDDNIRGEILKNSVGTLNMKIINDYMTLHNIS
jgi:hypothetical protein